MKPLTMTEEHEATIRRADKAWGPVITHAEVVRDRRDLLAEIDALRKLPAIAPCATTPCMRCGVVAAHHVYWTWARAPEALCDGCTKFARGIARSMSMNDHILIETIPDLRGVR